MKRTAVTMFSFCMALSLTLAPLNAATTRAVTPRTGAAALQKVASDAVTGITEYKLASNGLQVLLAERHHTPIVTVMVVYKVGSRNEAVGYTGATHFLEHMLFKGTAKHDPAKGTGIDDVLKPIGGINNATTFYDRTNYYETVPAQYMSTALELEADRMRNALLRQKDRDDEMTVVRNELERNEDDPARLIDVSLFAHAYMAHPYHHPVIGWRSDVEGVPTERLRQFYNDFYHPNNATLVVIGDFKSTEALNQIAKFFGPISAAPKPFPKVYTKENPQIGERRFTVTRGEDLPRVAIGFHIPNAVDKDTYPLEVAASLLGAQSKQSSRLYKSVVDPGLASDVYAYNYSLRDPGLFTMSATLTPGTPSDKVESVLFEQVQKLATEPISDEELDKAKKSVWKGMKLHAADPSGMSDQLAEAIAVADWKWWVDLEKNIKAVTKDQVAASVKKYLVRNNATIGYYYPTKKQEAPKAVSVLNVIAQEPTMTSPEAPPTPDQATPTTPSLPPKQDDTKPGPDDLQDRETGSAASAPITTPPATTTTTARASIAAQVQKKVLPNGLTVLAMPVKGLGVVSVAAKTKAGRYFHPPNLYSVPFFTAEMLDKGSTKWTKDALAQQLEIMGTDLSFSARNFWLDFNTDVVKEDLPQFLSIVADVVQNPLFPPEELGKLRKQTNARIQASMADTGEVAANALYRTLYKPECVFYNSPFKDQLAELDKITVDQLRAFHKAHVSPVNTVIAVVGDIEPNVAFDLVAKNFGQWSGPPAPKIAVDNCVVPGLAGKKIENNMPDKTNVDVLMGAAAPLSISSKDFYAASIANSALGHDTVSSRLAELRTKHGLTYGVGSYFTENAFENGAWIVTFSVNPQNLSKSLPVVDTIINDYIKKGITPKELQDEARRLGGQYVVERMRTPRQLADALTKYEILGLGAKFMDEYPVRLTKVTQAEANAAIRKYFDPKKTVMSVAGTLKK